MTYRYITCYLGNLNMLAIGIFYSDIMAMVDRNSCSDGFCSKALGYILAAQKVTKCLAMVLERGKYHIEHKIVSGHKHYDTRQTETSVVAPGQAVWSKYITNLPYTSQQGPAMKLKIQIIENKLLGNACPVMRQRVYSSWRSCFSPSCSSSSGVSAECLWIPCEESSSMISSSDMLITDTRWNETKQHRK